MFREKISKGLVHILSPLSMCIHQIERPGYFSINVLKTQNKSKASNLYLRNYTHVHLEKSSMNVSTYLAPKKEWKMTWGHYESTPKMPKHKWLMHVEKNPYVSFQVHNLEKHYLDRKSREAQELVLVCSSTEAIDNWHAQNVHAKSFLTESACTTKHDPISLEESKPSNL